MMKKVILAVDGGATKTEITVQTDEGTVLFHDKKTGANYQTIGLQSLRALIRSLITAVEKVCPEKIVEIAIFALAGIDTEEDEQKVRTLVEEVIHASDLEVRRLIVENDVESVMRGVLKKEPGILLISGTGSIAYGQDGKGKVTRVGGGGHLAGDEGSGYWIGREIIRAICKMEDGRGHATLLKASAFQLVGCRSVEELLKLRAVHEVAQLASVLESCCVKGDQEAIRIAGWAAEELASIVCTCLQACGLERETCKVMIGGGVLTHSFYLFRELKERIQIECPFCQLVVLAKRPIEFVIERGWNEGKRQ